MKGHLSVPLFALLTYLLYLSLIFALAHLPLSGDEPNILLDLLPVVIGVFVPAVASFLFLRKVKVDPGAFWMASTITTVLASSIIYALLTMNCTPTTCYENAIIWFFLTLLVLLGFSVGVLLYKLVEKLGSRSST